MMDANGAVAGVLQGMSQSTASKMIACVMQRTARGSHLACLAILCCPKMLNLRCGPYRLDKRMRSSSQTKMEHEKEKLFVKLLLALASRSSQRSFDVLVQGRRSLLANSKACACT